MSSISRIARRFSWALIFISQTILADNLPIGVSLNLSGRDAQYALEFKNGIDAYLKAANKSKRFKDHNLTLLAMDDLGKNQRALSNIKRLLKQKKVLAVLSNHNQAVLEQLLPITTKEKTLLLSSGYPIDQLSRKQADYSAFLSYEPSAFVGNLDRVFNGSKAVMVLSEQNDIEPQWLEFLQTKTNRDIEQYDDLMQLKNNLKEPTLVVLNERFLTSAKQISKLVNHPAQPKFLIMPQGGATLFNRAISWKLSNTERSRIFYLNTTPLHDGGLRLIRDFKRHMSELNPNALQSHQALKGYILTQLAVESIYHSVKGIQTDSIVDVATLPFQVLDQVFGWVSRAGGDIDGEQVANSFSRMKNYQMGLNHLINIDKSRTILNHIWLTQNTDGKQFVEVIQLGARQ